MADIFISYAQKDRDRVAPLVEALTAEGYDVWWDLRIRAGESFDELIESTLERVSCVVGVWSKHSVKSEWVRAECAWAKDQRVFVSVRIDEDARLPLKFYNVHTPSLADWAGSRTAENYRSLLRDIQALAGAPGGVAAAVPARQAPKVPEPEMVRIEPGSFLMGSAEGEGYDVERPQHEVRIARPFGIGRYPVTFEKYDAFAKATQRELPGDQGWGRERRPVISVSWEDAVAYAQWLSEQTEKSYRLPTEAEWEYAARAGTSTAWSFGDDKQTLHEFAWYSKNAEGKTHPVGEKAANPWDLHDVHGNVWEWVQDCWHGGYEGAPKDGSAWLEADGGNCGLRVVRGGSWNDEPVLLRSPDRFRLNAGNRNFDLGFRLAQDL